MDIYYKYPFLEDQWSGEVRLCFKDTSLSVHVCAQMCMYICNAHVCKHMYKCAHIHVKARGQPRMSFLRYHLPSFSDKVSHWPAASQFGQTSRASDLRELYDCLPSTGSLRTPPCPAFLCLDMELGSSWLTIPHPHLVS